MFRDSITTGLLAIGAAALLAGSAQATVSGNNGRIVVGDDEGGVITIKPDGSDLRQVDVSGVDDPHWSSNGRRLAVALEVSGGVGTALLDPDGSNFALQTSPDATQNFACVNWSPDDARMGCEVWDDVHPDRRPGIYTLHTSGWDTPVRLTTNTIGGHDLPGDWSPDGRQLAFLRTNAAEDETAVWVVDVATGTEHQVTEPFPDSATPSWSPDGRLLLFDDALGSIYTSRPDGSLRRRVRIAGHRDDPAFIPDWAPDGHHILFNMFIETDDGGFVGLYTATVGGGNVRPVIESAEKFYGHADWGVKPR